MRTVFLFAAHRRPSMIAGDRRLLFRRKMAVEGVDFNLHIAGDGIPRYLPFEEHPRLVSAESLAQEKADRVPFDFDMGN